MVIQSMFIEPKPNANRNMKATFMSILVLLGLQAYGRNYQPLLSDGKSWTMYQTNTSPAHGHDASYTCTVDKDTVVNGHACKVVVCRKEEYSNKFVMMETGGKLLYFDPDTERFLPILDFSLHAGDDVGEWGRVLTEDEILVGDRMRKRLFIGEGSQIACVVKAIWVEGVGSSDDSWITLMGRHIGDYSCMTECRENGEIVFTQEDFCKPEEQVYQPVLADGRVWKLSYAYRNNWQDMPDAYMTLAVDGDSIVAGRKCRKLLVDYRNAAAVVYPKYIVAYENNGCVYRIDEDGKEHLVMNMNLHKGDAVGDVQTILAEDVVVIDGVRRKRLMVDSGFDHPDGEYIYYMVEGIGMSKDEFVNLGLRDGNIYFHRLTACYEHGKCIFSASDFLKEGTDGLHTPSMVCPTDDTAYDVQGRRRSCMMSGKVFIRGGRKHINP